MDANYATSIKISPRFFAIEKQNYSCWRSAVVRELIQNSIDAGAKKIEFTITQNSILCKDDGCGMTKEEVLNKFLTLGGTGKQDGHSIGGFSKAKILLAYSQESYKIRSFDYLVEGCGGDFEILENPYIKGCEFEIETSSEDWEYYIKKVVSLCNFRSTIILNGQAVNSEVIRGRYVRDLSFGAVWVNKSAKPQILVRVGGVIMFRRSTSAPAQIIIEINPEKSREVLLSNRDSLVWEKQNELDSFANELASESESALKPKKQSFIKFMKKGAAFVSQKKVLTAAFATKFNEDDFKISFSENLEIKPEKQFQKSNWLDAAVLVVDTYNEEIHKLSAFYDPENWKGNETRMKLLKIWKTILDFVTEKYSERTGQSFNWGTGWIFSEDCAAQCRNEDGIYYLLLNPINEEKNMRYSITKRESFSELLVTAVHEVAHVAAQYHNETFAATMTYLMMDCLKEEGELWQTVRNCK